MDSEIIDRERSDEKPGQLHDLFYFHAFRIERSHHGNVTILEFCEKEAVALPLWRVYLPRARIIGVFPDNITAALCPAGIEIEIGDQHDPDFLARLVRLYRPIIVVDHSTPVWSGQQLRLQLLYQTIPPDGVYIVEFAHVGETGERLVIHEGAACGILPYLLALAQAFTSQMPDVVAQMDNFAAEFVRQTASICFGAGTCAIQKASGWHALAATRTARDSAVVVAELDNGGPYTRIPAQIVSAPRWLLDLWQAEADTQVVHPPRAAVVELTDVTVHYEGVIVAATGEVVEESLINTDSLPEFGPLLRDPRLRLRRSPPVHQHLIGSNLVLLKQTWDTNFGHWLVESLPRVDLVAERYDLRSCQFIVSAGGAMRRLYLDTLAHFGIRESQIIWADNQSFTADRLIYPLPMTVHPWVKAPRVRRVLERLAAEIVPASRPAHRLYISRNAASRRRLLNEPDIIRVLAPRGYAVVNPEMLTFDEQVRLFKDADTIVGNLGAALTNIVFSGPGVTLFALTSEFMKDDFYWDILCHKQGRYISLHGSAEDPGLGMQSDFTIDVARFVEILDGLESAS